MHLEAIIQPTPEQQTQLKLLKQQKVVNCLT